MSDPKHPDLGPRKWRILRAIVWDYVETAEPVGSEALVQRHQLDVKPATVRNEMADLLERGYLSQPHTSAGRVPSDTGYRYYVDRIDSSEPPNPEVRAQIRSIRKQWDDTGMLLQETVHLLSRVSDYIALATTMKNETVRVQQTLLTPVAKDRVLMVAVLSNAHVENRLLEPGTPCSAEDLTRANEMLNHFAAGRTLREVTRVRPQDREDVSPIVREIYSRAVRELKGMARNLSRSKTIHDGVANLLNQPEFQRDVAALQRVLAILDDAIALDYALSHDGSVGSAVVIGTEAGKDDLAGCSMVAARFHVGGTEAGAIALLGPTRMRYEQAVSLVRYTAQALSETMTKMLRE